MQNTCHAIIQNLFLMSQGISGCFLNRASHDNKLKISLQNKNDLYKTVPEMNVQCKQPVKIIVLPRNVLLIFYILYTDVHAWLIWSDEHTNKTNHQIEYQNVPSLIFDSSCPSRKSKMSVPIIISLFSSVLFSFRRASDQNIISNNLELSSHAYHIVCWFSIPYCFKKFIKN